MPRTARTVGKTQSVGALLLAAAVLLAAGFAHVAGWAKALAPAPAPAPAEDLSPEAARSAAAKLERIAEAHDSGNSFGTIRFTELEANSYLAYEFSDTIPSGVSEVRLRFQPGRVGGSAVVDFDKLKEGLRTPPHPIAEFLLRGVHTIEGDGAASGSGGIGEFRLERVLLDGVELPRVVIDYMIEQYLFPRYPNAPIDRPFRLPYSIDSFRAETGSVVLTGK